MKGKEKCGNSVILLVASCSNSANWTTIMLTSKFSVDCGMQEGLPGTVRQQRVVNSWLTLRQAHSPSWGNEKGNLEDSALS